MPIPTGMGRINKVGANRVTQYFAPIVPGFALVVHHGRRTGTEYRTPVNVFRTDTGYLIALAYGAKTDWVKNVLAEGGCTLLTSGRSIRCAHPEVYKDPQLSHVRPLERMAFLALGVDQLMALQTVWSAAARRH